MTQNMLQTGAQWKSEQRHSHGASVVSLNGISLRATFSGQYSYTAENGIKVQTQIYEFIFRYSDIVANSISITKGLELEYEGVEYSACSDKSILYDFDDPYNYDIIIRFDKRG